MIKIPSSTLHILVETAEEFWQQESHPSTYETTVEHIALCAIPEHLKKLWAAQQKIVEDSGFLVLLDAGLVPRKALIGRNSVARIYANIQKQDYSPVSEDLKSDIDYISSDVRQLIVSFDFESLKSIDSHLQDYGMFTSIQARRIRSLAKSLKTAEKKAVVQGYDSDKDSLTEDGLQKVLDDIEKSKPYYGAHKIKLHKHKAKLGSIPTDMVGKPVSFDYAGAKVPIVCWDLQKLHKELEKLDGFISYEQSMQKHPGWYDRFKQCKYHVMGNYQPDRVDDAIESSKPIFFHENFFEKLDESYDSFVNSK